MHTVYTFIFLWAQERQLAPVLHIHFVGYVGQALLAALRVVPFGPSAKLC